MKLLYLSLTTALRLRIPSEMDPRLYVQFLILGLSCVTQVLSLSIPPIGADQEGPRNNLLTAHMLELDRAVDIKSACPILKTYCIPRNKCPAKSVVYDREALRFIHREDNFEDHFACGAFTPTWTYVCCSTLEKVESFGDWQPKSDLWFFPSQDGSPPAKDVDPSAPFPVMSLWPGDDSGTKSTTPSNSDSSTDKPTEKPKDKQQNERSVAPEQPTKTTPPQPGTTPFMLTPEQQFNAQQMAMANDPMHVAMMNQQRLLFPFGTDPRIPLGQMDPMLLQRFAASLPNKLVERFWILSDGWWLRILINPRNAEVVDVILERMPNQRPTLDAPQDRPVPAIVAASDRHESSSRTRRATDSKSFKVPPAAGGMWTGENSTDAQGRALLPPPKAVWGSPGSGNVPLRPIPQAFGVDNERCGISSSSGINARILSGRKPGSQFEAETSFAEFPWHVAVVNGETGDYLCAGTIISARFVLTVAHCVRKFQLTLLFVRVGDWDLSGVGEMFPSYDIEVQKVTVHEDFYAGNLQNDIALLQLKFPIDFTVMPHVGTICLPPSSDPIYSDCIVTGWGQQLATAEAKGDAATFSRTLKQTSQTLMTAQFCEKALRPFLGQFYQLPKKGFVCAYDKDGKDSCFGDGGGALACLVNAPNYPKPSQYHVVGLVSWGVGCGMPNVPSAYTAVWDYLDWIRAKISPLDPYPVANSQPLKEPSPVIMVRSNEASSTTTSTPKTTIRDFIDLAFS